MLLKSLACDAGRVAAAAAVCRARHADRDAPGWDEAAVLLEQVLQRLRDVGADRDEQTAA